MEYLENRSLVFTIVGELLLKQEFSKKNNKTIKIVALKRVNKKVR